MKGKESKRKKKKVKESKRKKKKVVIEKEFMFPENIKSTLNEVKKGKTFVLMMSLMIRRVT